MNIAIITHKQNSRMPGLRYARAFQSLGHSVVVHDFTEQFLLEEICIGRNIDFILYDDSGGYEEFIKWPTVQSYGLCIDSAIEGGVRSFNQTKNLDHVFFAQLNQLDRYKNQGTFLPNAHDSIIEGEYQFNFWDREIFAGAIGDYHGRKDRIKLREELEFLFNSDKKQLISFRNDIPFENLSNFYRNVAVTINSNEYNDVNLRCFEAAGNGSLLLINPSCEQNGLSQLGFEDGVNCIFYHNYNDCIEMLSYLYVAYSVKKPWLETIAKNGYDLVNKFHTYTERCKTMLNVHSKLIKSPELVVGATSATGTSQNQS